MFRKKKADHLVDKTLVAQSPLVRHSAKRIAGRKAFLCVNGKRIKLDKRRKYKIGRGENCTIQLMNPKVSRTHGCIQWDSKAKAFIFIDLNSRNGSAINGEAVSFALLKNGDIIELWGDKLLFEEKTKAQNTSPEKNQLPPPTNSQTALIERKFASVMRQVNDENLKNQLQEYHLLILSIRKQLSALAYHDQMTGLFNRRYFDLTVERELKLSIRNQTPLTVIMIDIDHFKQFNDTYGHQKGDEVLEGVAGFIRSAIRETDIACRYGGEEMVVILPNTPLDKAKQVAEKIRKNVADYSFKNFGVAVTISLGVATNTNQCKNPAQLIKMADCALYCAKQQGRNRTVAANQN